jgi:hypothetical protein
MSCLINAGLSRDCGFSFGGLKALYLISKEEVASVAKASDNTITGITLTSGATTFHQFDFEPNTGQLLQELQTGSASRFVNQTINGQFANLTQAKKEVLETLANAYVVGIAQDQSGKYWYAGESGRGLIATSLSIDTGLAEADAYVATISLVGGALGYANQVADAAVSAVI